MKEIQEKQNNYPSAANFHQKRQQQEIQDILEDPSQGNSEPLFPWRVIYQHM